MRYTCRHLEALVRLGEREVVGFEDGRKLVGVNLTSLPQLQRASERAGVGSGCGEGDARLCVTAKTAHTPTHRSIRSTRCTPFALAARRPARTRRTRSHLAIFPRRQKLLFRLGLLLPEHAASSAAHGARATALRGWHDGCDFVNGTVIPVPY